MFLRFLYLTYLINIVKCFNIAIIGASSGLGKELIYKGITEKNLTILAFTSKSQIYKYNSIIKGKLLLYFHF